MKVKKVESDKPIEVTPISERFYDLSDDIEIKVTTDEGVLVYKAKKGCRTNFRSGCAGVDIFVDHIGNPDTQFAYFCHDLAYNADKDGNHILSKPTADDLLEKMLIYAGHSKFMACLVKRSVELFGKSAYEEYDDVCKHNEGLFSLEWRAK